MCASLSNGLSSCVWCIYKNRLKSLNIDLKVKAREMRQQKKLESWIAHLIQRLWKFNFGQTYCASRSTLARYLLILDRLKLDSIRIYTYNQPSRWWSKREKKRLCNRVLKVSKFSAWVSALIKALTYTFYFYIHLRPCFFAQKHSISISHSLLGLVLKIEKYFNNSSSINKLTNTNLETSIFN